jgi:putative DNA methylase
MLIPAEHISKISTEEKYVRSGHYNSIKGWWARRPVRAMRAIILNELYERGIIDTVSDELVDAINPSIKQVSKDIPLNTVRNLSLLDVFSGGGSIPLESARLGLKTYASELNPVAGLLLETVFSATEYPGFPALLHTNGTEVLKRAKKRLMPFFEVDGKYPYVFFWARTAKCNCGEEYPLSRIGFLSQRKNSTISIEDVTGIKMPEPKTKKFICPKCESEYSFKDIKDYCQDQKLGHEPICLVYYDGKKDYQVYTKIQAQSSFDEVNDELKKVSRFIPQDKVEARHGVINPTLYDLKNVPDYFNQRQLLVLAVLLEEITKQYNKVREEDGPELAKLIARGLTPLIEFLVDWNSTATMWISQNQQTGRSLAGPGVAMRWDYIEVNPFFHKGSNLFSKLDRVVESLSQLHLSNKVDVFIGSSASINLPSNHVDMVVTDPPYMDSVDYTGLSEFFRPWFDLLARRTYNVDGDYANDTSKEAIAELTGKKEGKKKKGVNEYGKLMQSVFTEAHRVLKDDGTLTFVYGHKTLEGWDILVPIIKESGFYVNDCYPLEMERAARPRGMGSDSLNGVVCFRLTKNPAFEALPEPEEMVVEEVLKHKVSNSQLPIFLAGLAVKRAVHGQDFALAYSEIMAAYQTTRINPDNIDASISAYIKARDNQKMSVTEQQLLSQSFNNNEILSLDRISLDTLPTGVFKQVVQLFQDNANATAVKIPLEEGLFHNAVALFSIASGTELNSLQHRSFSGEKKIARTLLSKVCVA